MGVNEFTDFCKGVGATLMMTVNLGTRGAQEAAGLQQYCSVAGGPYWGYLPLDRPNLLFTE